MYKFSGWLVKRKILEFAKVVRSEREQLDLLVDEYMSWHQKVMLDRYINVLKHLRAHIETREVVKLDLENLNDVYQITFLELYKKLYPLLSHMNDSQVDVFRKKILEKTEFHKNKEFQDLFTENTQLYRSYFGQFPKNENLLLIKKVSQSELNHRKARQAKTGSMIEIFFSCFYVEKKEECLSAYSSTIKNGLYIIESSEMDDWKDILNNLSVSETQHFIKFLESSEKTILSLKTVNLL